VFHGEAWKEDLYVGHSKSNLYLKLTILGMNFKLFLPAGMKHQVPHQKSHRNILIPYAHICTHLQPNLFLFSSPAGMELSSR
jgi:hypothetical protein